MHGCPCGLGPEHGDGPATPATRDLRPEQSGRPIRVRNEIHQTVRAIAAEPARRVAGMRAKHQRTHRHRRVWSVEPVLQLRREPRHAIVLEDGIRFDAAEAMKRLAARGIGTRPFFWGMHEQPVLRAQGLFEREKYPVSERLARRGLYVPSGLTITETQIDRVCDAIRRVLS